MGEQTVSVESLDSLMFHAALVTLVMLVGYLLRTPFVLAEELFPTGSFFEKSNLLSVLPLFLFCLLAGLSIQKIIDAHFTDRITGRSFIDRATMERISNSAQVREQAQWSVSNAISSLRRVRLCTSARA